MNKSMPFREALETLGITEFSERILQSNSHGELFHCYDYILLAKHFKKEHKETFRTAFLEIVKFAEDNWSRSESVFQHIPELMQQYATAMKQANE